MLGGGSKVCASKCLDQGLVKQLLGWLRSTYGLNQAFAQLGGGGGGGQGGFTMRSFVDGDGSY